jgi:hypothetical protein
MPFLFPMRSQIPGDEREILQGTLGLLRAAALPESPFAWRHGPGHEKTTCGAKKKRIETIRASMNMSPLMANLFRVNIPHHPSG